MADENNTPSESLRPPDGLRQRDRAVPALRAVIALLERETPARKPASIPVLVRRNLNWQSVD